MTNIAGFTCRKLNASDWVILRRFAIESTKAKAPASMLGKSDKENRDLCSAYSKNTDLYPYAFVLQSEADTKPVGLLIAQASANNSLELSIVYNGENATKRKKEIYNDFKKIVAPVAVIFD